MNKFKNNTAQLEYYCRFLIYSIALIMLLIFLFKYIHDAFSMIAWIIVLISLLIMHMDTHIILYNKMSKYKTYNEINNLMKPYNKWYKKQTRR